MLDRLVKFIQFMVTIQVKSSALLAPLIPPFVVMAVLDRLFFQWPGKSDGFGLPKNLQQV